MSADCQHTRELMDSYLSEELSVETNHIVLHHLAACPACASEVKRRQHVRTLLAQSLDAPLNAERVTQRITQAIDREHRSWRQFRLRTFGASARQVAGWWGIAAALIAGVAVTFWVTRPIDAAAYDDSAANHVACALGFPPSVTFDPERAARNLVPPYERIAEAIGLTHGAYNVIDAHMCPYNGRDYAHVVLRGNDQMLSVFVEPAVRGSLPTAAITTRLTGDAIEVLSASRQGYRVSAASTSKHRVFLVSQYPADTPDQAANEILLSAVRFVRTLER